MQNTSQSLRALGVIFSNPVIRMSFISDFRKLFQSKNILVEIDPIVLPQTSLIDRINTTQTISFSLYKLIYHIGTIQSRRFATSNRLKFIDKLDLLEKIYSNNPEFRLKINDIRVNNGSETLKSITEDLGIGISVVLAEKFFDVNSSTIQKIYGTGKRPDWKCQFNDGRILVVEGKGSISIDTSRTQERNALVQKTKEPGDIQIASLSIFKENEISCNRYIDPPIESDEMDSELKKHILRAGHYASVFSFLGNSRLSKYYSQMRKRLLGTITTKEQNLKNNEFNSLYYSEPIIEFNNIDFVGNFFKIEEDSFLFVGVDKRLLSYNGFINFNDLNYDIEIDQDENHYILYRDGILIIEVNNFSVFSKIIDKEKIKNYQENITISDIDEMNEISFSKYFEYLLDKIGFTNIVKENFDRESNFRFDLSANYRNEVFYFEFKIFNNKIILKNSINNLLERDITKKIVLVTNQNLKDFNYNKEKLIIIDRKALSEILKNNKKLLSYL